MERITAQEALKHPWFQFASLSKDKRLEIKGALENKEGRNINESDNVQKQGSAEMAITSLSKIEELVDPNILGYLQTYTKQTNRLQRAVLNVLVKLIDIPSVSHLRVQFQLIDTTNTGTINYEKLKSAFTNQNIDLNEHDLKSLIDVVDMNSNNQIDYSEFIAATINIKTVLTSELIYYLFKEFDLNDKDIIGKEDIKQTMIKFSIYSVKNSVKVMFDELDIPSNTLITLEKFKEIMLKQESPNKNNAIDVNV